MDAVVETQWKLGVVGSGTRLMSSLCVCIELQSQIDSHILLIIAISIDILRNWVRMSNHVKNYVRRWLYCSIEKRNHFICSRNLTRQFVAIDH